MPASTDLGRRFRAAAGGLVLAVVAGGSFAEEPAYVYSDKVADGVCHTKCGVAQGVTAAPATDAAMCMANCLSAPPRAAPIPVSDVASRPKPSADELRTMAIDRAPATTEAAPTPVTEGPPAASRRHGGFRLSCLWRRRDPAC
jgi:hypothetical protein